MVLSCWVNDHGDSKADWLVGYCCLVGMLITLEVHHHPDDAGKKKKQLDLFL